LYNNTENLNRLNFISIPINNIIYFFLLLFAILCINILNEVEAKNVFVSPSEIIEVNAGQSPQDITYNPKTNILYVTNGRSDSVSVINGTTNKILSNISVGKRPGDIEVNVETNEIYVQNGYIKDEKKSCYGNILIIYSQL